VRNVFVAMVNRNAFTCLQWNDFLYAILANMHVYEAF
jgi:hypothetical protein